ncbi:hypothetical protein [Lichenifustis flavocetrariae]|uniref:Uncharacterized protein n=1 Tax=Lichenifustis flavocetrariae TaxID=2949735 RepID=A0AA41Z8F2_9HYPH|nr:hypothetical protein [Lichenifustis flavocetrariae]MCW6511232.1 hypothetical protein [Lichenifustis flavocetrariae]
MKKRAGILAGVALLGTFVGTARAQPAAGAADVDQSPASTDIAKRPGTLSEKLNTTNGVIHPQGDVDPGIHKSAPKTGTMPVIPPPGGPGDTGDVQPK